MTTRVTRRTALAAAFALPRIFARTPTQRPLAVSLFSKHVQFLQGAELARSVAEMGFDGIDLTVRAGGHIEPARVAEDLPPLVALLHEHHLATPMVTTDIVDTDTPHARVVLKTLAELGIRHYRWGGFKYQANAPLAEQLETCRRRAAKLAALNAEFKVCAMYHTHSGVGMVGAPVWDIYQVLKGLDPESVSINYDIGHATVEGGLGGWIDSFNLSKDYIRGIAVKDFLWGKNARGEWDAMWTPLGQGMVRFPAFFKMLAQTPFYGPLQLHFEYPLGGADAGQRQITMPPEEIFESMRRDLRQLRGYLRGAGLADGQA